MQKGATSGVNRALTRKMRSLKRKKTRPPFYGLRRSRVIGPGG